MTDQFPAPVLKPALPRREEPVCAPFKPFTTKRAVALCTWWLMCLLLPPLAVVAGGFMGAVRGLVEGIVRSLNETKSDLTRWWRMFERS